MANVKGSLRPANRVHAIRGRSACPRPLRCSSPAPWAVIQLYSEWGNSVKPGGACRPFHLRDLGAAVAFGQRRLVPDLRASAASSLLPLGVLTDFTKKHGLPLV